MATSKSEKVDSKKSTNKKAEIPKTDNAKVDSKTKKQDSTAEKSYVISINNVQYITKVGQKLKIKVGKKATKKDLDIKVLAILDPIDPAKSEVGRPELKAKIEFELSEDIVKLAKVTKKIFKAKSRYRRKVGFRPVAREFTLTSIS